MYQRLVSRAPDLNEVDSMDPSSASRTFLDPAVTVQIPRIRKRSVSSVPPSDAVTDKRARTAKAQKLKSCWIVDTQVRAESWVLPLGGLRRVAVDPRQDPASLHFWTSSGGCRDQLTSGHTPSVWIALDYNRHGENKWYSRNNGLLWFHSLLIKYQVDVVPGERQRFVPVIFKALKSVLTMTWSQSCEKKVKH